MKSTTASVRVKRDGNESPQTRERVLDAAAIVLSQRGYAGTRLAEIAKIAGIQAPALYYYFESRDELIQEVMRVGSARTRDFVEQSVAEMPPDSTSLDRIAKAIEAHLRIILTMSAYATAATRNAGQVPESIRQVQLNEQQQYGDFWRELFSEAAAAGEIRDDLDTRASRMFILGALNWAPEWWDAQRGPVDDVIATATSLIIDGLRPPR